VSKLSRSAYLDPNPPRLAKFFLGKYLFVNSPKGLCGGIIYETEAYGGAKDKASHAYGNRRTARTEIMFSSGGYAYVYLCYGMYYLLNLVTGPKDVPQAILIRGVYITEGVEIVKARRKGIDQKHWASGPGKVTLALGVTKKHQGCDLTGDTIWLEDRGIKVPSKEIVASPRVGIDYAEEWVHKPWRFVWNYESVASCSGGL
jgi:DNA-3-methyladenine glycosylase